MISLLEGVVKRSEVLALMKKISNISSFRGHATIYGSHEFPISYDKKFKWRSMGARKSSLLRLESVRISWLTYDSSKALKAGEIKSGFYGIYLDPSSIALNGIQFNPLYIDEITGEEVRHHNQKASFKDDYSMLSTFILKKKYTPYKGMIPIFLVDKETGDVSLVENQHSKIKMAENSLSKTVEQMLKGKLFVPSISIHKKIVSSLNPLIYLAPIKELPPILKDVVIEGIKSS